MKYLCAILIACTLLISCSKSDDSLTVAHLTAPAVVPPAISQLHILDNDGGVYARYLFDENGRYIETISTHESMTYSYDSENKITSILTQDFETGTSVSYDIVYDSNDKVLSIGDRTFDYDPLTDSYIEEVYYNNDYELIGDLEYVWNVYKKFIFQNPSNPIPQYCYYIELVITNLVTGEVTTSGYCDSLQSFQTTYVDNNVTSHGNYESSAHLEFDTEVNPLNDTFTNLRYIHGFLLNGNWPHGHNYLLMSANKIVHGEYEPEDPESWAYSYRLNSFNLPFEMTVQYFYVGQLEAERLAARYYYQGDDIPDYNSEK